MISITFLLFFLLTPIIVEPNGIEGGILIRKLRSATETPDINQVETWKDKVTGLFLKSIELFSTKSNENNNYTDTAPQTEKPSLFIRCFSEVLNVYKKYIYDSIWYRPPPDGDVTSVAPTIADPKDEVEIIEPKYHGKLCEGDGCSAREAKKEGQTDSPRVIVKREDAESVKDCGDGAIRDDKGNCVTIDAKFQRFIFSVPDHCPFGFKKDRLGYCRPLW